MPNRIKPRRSYTANSVPLTTDLEVNELAIRWDASSPAIFTKNASGQIVTVALGGSSGGGSSSLVTAATVAGFPATGSTANIYATTGTNRIYRWDATNSVYVELGPVSGGSDTLLRSYLVPTAPTNVTATAGNAQVSLTWTAASSLSQIPITDYLIQSSTDNGTTWTLASDTVSTATSATITGLTNGTAYRFRVAGVNGVGTGAYSAASSAVTPVSGDALFGSVSLLLHMDGTGSAFTDSSAYNRTITANGGATQSTAQSKWGGKSASFGTGADRLLVSAPSPGSGDWVVEGWFYKNGSSWGDSVHRYILDAGGGQANGALQIFVNYFNQTIRLGRSGVAPLLDYSFSLLSASQWYHMAWVRSGTSYSLYVDGARVATVTDSSSPSPQNTFAVGGQSGGNGFNGFIDDLRITVGTDRGYTGSTITVPTAPFPDA